MQGQLLYFHLIARGFMHQKIVLSVVLLGALSGFMSEAQSSEESVGYARIRVYQEGDITLYPGEYCYGSDSSAAIHASTSGFTFFSIAKRVGMPETDDIPGAYNEYEIPAGKAISVMLQWQGEKDGVKASCGPIGSTFYPQSAKNYDISLGYSGGCFVRIRELHKTAPGKASAIVAPSGFSYACAAK